MTSKCFILTVDGPAASGKSSVCKEVAKRKDWFFFSSGAIYRGVGLLIRLEGFDPHKEKDRLKAAQTYAALEDIDFSGRTFHWKGNDIGDQLRDSDIGQLASVVGRCPLVRDALLEMQRELPKKLGAKGFITEGRDMGSIIYPHADLKIYLTASAHTRAERRLRQRGLDPAIAVAELNSLASEIAQRDERDQNRKVAPLITPEGAHVIETDDLDQNQTVATVMDLIAVK